MLNKKYITNKKNNGNIPNIKDERTRYVPIGCGVCIECLKQKANQWNIRLNEEYKSNNIAQFVTLTFSEEKIKELSEKYTKLNTGILTDPHQNNELAIFAVRYFLERWREKHKKSIKHWLVTELGHNGTERIHLHGLMWTKEKDEIEKIWQYGWVFIGNYVNESTINYIIKYITKIDTKHKWFRPKILCSPGIGANYTHSHNFKLKKFNQEKTDESYNFKNGKKGSLPTYYRNKIYSEDEREKLWIQRLNKEERWVRGTKIDISKGLDEYCKIRDYHRERNVAMGYGHIDTNEKNIKKIYQILKK